MSVAAEIAARYDAARTDAALVQVALFVEQVGVLAYDAAAAGPLSGADRAHAARFAGHEREHAAAFATMLLALTVPVRSNATPADVAELLPGLDRDPRRALELLAELEAAAIAGHPPAVSKPAPEPIPCSGTHRRDAKRPRHSTSVRSSSSSCSSSPSSSWVPSDCPRSASRSATGCVSSRTPSAATTATTTRTRS